MGYSTFETNPHFIGWAVGLPISYILLCSGFRALNLWPQKLPKGTRGSDYMAFDVVAGTSLIFFGFVGTVAWLDLFGTEWTYRVLEDDKFYGNADFVQHYLIIPIMLYQFWNTVLCFVLNDMRDPVMMVHHSLTGLLAYAATHPFACYYALFFFGMSETTQLPLTVIDVLDHFPDIKKNHGTIDAVSKNLFGLLFFIIRIFFWTIVSIEFWKESLSLLQQSHVHDKRVVVFMLFANVILTSMQYFWAIKIIKIAIFSSPPVIKKD